MSLNRRDALKIAGGAALVAALAGPAFARVKPKKVLILGGTGFIGPHFVHALTEGGHTVTLFNRGKKDPDAKTGVEQLLGDRDGQLDALKGRDWDVVIDNSGYYPRHVQLSIALLKPRVKHYIFISSIAAYANFAVPNIDEDYTLEKLVGPVVEERSGKTYGALKVLCEQEVEKSYGEHATIIRPTYIAGPGDHTDRFTYWPFRVSKGGEMLAPGTPNDTISYIDVRDLAEFMRTCVEKRVGGKYNLCTPSGSVTMGRLLETSKRVTAADTKLVWASEEFLTKQGVIGDAPTATGLPIWSPQSGDSAGLGLLSSKRAVAKGLKYRSLETTIRETLDWQKGRPAESQTLKAGLNPEREAELLKALHA